MVRKAAGVKGTDAEVKLMAMSLAGYWE